MNATTEITLPVQGKRVTMRTRILGGDRSEAIAYSLDGADEDQPTRRYLLASEALAASLITEWDARDPETGDMLLPSVQSLRRLDADDYEAILLAVNKLREGRSEEADIPFGNDSSTSSAATKSPRRRS